MKRFITFLLLNFLTLTFVFSQVKQNIPDWINNFQEIEGKTSRVVVIKGEYGSTVEKAEAKAIQALKDKERVNDGEYRVIDKFIAYNSDRTWAYCYLLAQVCKKNSKCDQWEQVELSTTKYPFSARCFVPGMAQIYKGSAGKGGAIIAAEIVGVAGIVTSFSMKAAHDAYLYDPKGLSMQDIDYHDRSSNMWANIGYGSIAFTAAMYIYNIIDGAVAPGKKHIQIGSKAYDLSFTPTATMQGDFGFAAKLNF